MLSDTELILLDQLIDLEERDNAKDSLWAYCQYSDPEFFTDGKWHLRKIATALQLVELGAIKKLMISLPPRYGKSYLVSRFCTWLLGKYNTQSIMRNSYSASLAETFSYHIREFIQEEKTTNVFEDLELKKDKKSVSEWALSTSKRTAYFCAGVGGSVTGKGCDLVGILDDPIKDINDALSETILDKTWAWYTSTHKARFESGCPEIQIATRWSRRDIIGRIKENNEVIDFDEYLQCPYLYKDYWIEILVPELIDGESACPEIRTTKESLEIKELTDDFIFEAEYMQQPIEAKGLLYPIEELNRFKLDDIKDKAIHRLGVCDVADEGSDNLASGIFDLVQSEDGLRVYLIDVIFTKESTEITENLIAKQLFELMPSEHEFESNNGGKSFARLVENKLKELKPQKRSRITWKHTRENKETRMLIECANIKKMFYFRNDYKQGSDYDKFMRELTSLVKLAKNKHDDSGDMVTMMSEKINKPSGVRPLRR